MALNLEDNYSMLEYDSPNPVTMLSNAIVEQGLKDYLKAIKNIKRYEKKGIENLSINQFERYNKMVYMKMECECFFRSDWFKKLSNYDGYKIIKEVQERELWKL